MCCDAGFEGVETYIASGNVVFDAQTRPAKVKAELEARLQSYASKPVRVVVRSADEMAAVLKANPFSKTDTKSTYVVFLDEPPPPDALKKAAGRTNEEMRLGQREIFIYYPDGMGRSKLKIPAAATGTARNLNTVSKLVQMAGKP